MASPISGGRDFTATGGSEAARTKWTVDAAFQVRFVHRLRFTRHALDPANPTLADVVREGGGLPAKVLVFVDSSVALNNANLLAHLDAYTRAHPDVMRITGPMQTVPGGEECKNRPEVVDAALRAIDAGGLCRQSYIIVIGGGAVLDAVGYAAALAHRGIRLIRFPTTTLSQADSGVGVKNGINTFGKKNYLGIFAVPWAVINDEIFLDSLSDRDWFCGFGEAVKVSLLNDAGFFEHICASLDGIRRRDYAVTMPILRRSAELHLRHITDGGDPFEMTTAHPLDFGHWAAHKLEQMTDFRLRHGEAVALGLALDVVYSSKIGLLDWDVAERVVDCLEALNLETYDPAMRDTETLLGGIEEFRQHLGGTLTIALVKGIGRPIDMHEMHRQQILESVDYLARRADLHGG